MNANQVFENYGEQNRQVIEEDKSGSRTRRNSGRKDQEFEYSTPSPDKNALEARVQSLKQTISALRTELMEEKALWKKEVDLMASLLSANERYLEPEIISDQELDLKSVSNIPIASSDSLSSSPLIRDYEEKLCRYQGALAQAQAEKRLNIRRQIVANTYRKRLNEVEKLCQEELDKVRETATFLEPLKQMASEWNKSKTNYTEPLIKSPTEKAKRKFNSGVECGGDFLPARGKETQTQQEAENFEVPVKQIDASLVVDEDASNEIKGKIVLQIGSLPSEVPTICYSAKFE